MPGLRVDASAGVLNGFQFGSGVGGFLSVDLLGSYTLLRLPERSGLGGSSMAVGAGARVGILRESIALPGVSISAVRRWHGKVQAGSLEDRTAGEAETDIQITSIRSLPARTGLLSV